MWYNIHMKIAFPEITTNPIARQAITAFPEINFLPADNLDTAAEMVAKGTANSLISGIDFPSRDVVLACKAFISLSSAYFSSCFVCERQDVHFVLADGGINKQPTEDQLYCIVEDSAKTYETFYDDIPRIAMLSYSTKSSGGKNPDLDKIYSVINRIRHNYPNWLIDGEMQLDAAINPTVAAKKTPDSPLKGNANVLITPDLNSGNILYKSLERFGGFTIAGPIIQGFTSPIADLSRGSTVNDIVLTINVIKKLHERKS